MASSIQFPFSNCCSQLLKICGKWMAQKRWHQLNQTGLHDLGLFRTWMLTCCTYQPVIPSLVWPSPWLTSGLRKYNKPFSLTFKACRIDEQNLIVHAVSCKQSKHQAPPFLPLPQRLRLQTSSSSQILGDLSKQTCIDSQVSKSV